MNLIEIDPRARTRLMTAIDEMIFSWPEERRAAFDERYGDRENAWSARVVVDQAAGLAAVDLSLMDAEHGFVKVALIDGARIGYHLLADELVYVDEA